MKYLYTISLCLIFSFFININITNAQACVSNKDKEIVCATKVASSLSPATAKDSADAQISTVGGNSSTKGNTSTASTEVSASTSAGTNPQGLEEGLNTFKGEDSGLNTTGTLISFIANIIRWILGILGTVFFVIVVMQGYLYMTAGGDSGKTASAVGAIGNAVIGLLIIMGAFLITNFVTSALLAS